MPDKPRILHLSGDFPDPLVPQKTDAIASLVALTADKFDHRVISLNRTGPSPHQLATIVTGAGDPCRLLGPATVFEQGAVFTYAAPSKGVFHKTALHRLADALAHWMHANWSDSWRPGLIVGHKLTIEGVAVRRLSERLGIPFALSLQGNTDGRITAARPDLEREWQAIFHGARVVFPFAPWTLRMLEARLGPRKSASVLLPCATDLDTPLAPVQNGRGLASVFHLSGHRWKNLHGMAQASKILAARGDGQPFAVIGGGPDQLRAQLGQRYGGIPGLQFEGHCDRPQLQARLNAAKGFVLPSLRDSFGMVFVEALFAGAPILYPEGRAVDGYFDDLPFAVRVNPRDTRAIADGMAKMVREERVLKAALADWQSSDHAKQFTRSRIGEAFSHGLRIALRDN